MKIKVKTSFAFAYDGVRVVRYIPGIYDVSDRCGKLAIAEGWAVKHVKKSKKVG